VSLSLLATALITDALAVPLFHQILFFLFHLFGQIPVAPLPFGVQEVVSASFWGIVFALTVLRFFQGQAIGSHSAIIGRIGADGCLQVRCRAAQDQCFAAEYGESVRYRFPAKRGLGDWLGRAATGDRPTAQAAGHSARLWAVLSKKVQFLTQCKEPGSAPPSRVV
jgi:hypothetical protein